MGDNAKTREQLLQEWKDQKGAKTVSSLANVTNQHLPRAFSGTNRPFPNQASAQPLTIEVEDDVLMEDNLLETPSARKPALPGPQKQQMEQRIHFLRNRLHAIKRDSIRPSISGPPGAAQPSAAPAPGLVSSRPRAR